MEIKNITLEEALQFSNREEDHFFDRKAFGIQAKKIQKIACAFANADGGEFVIGIADSKDQPNPELGWMGAPNIEAFNQVIQALMEITPSIDVSYSFLSCRDKKRNCFIS